jgi:hypothetical protein
MQDCVYLRQGGSERRTTTLRQTNIMGHMTAYAKGIPYAVWAMCSGMRTD